jgi:hypothetical protein
MKEIELPVLPADTPLHSAMATLHAVNRSAVVTVQNDDVFLIHAWSIVSAANHGGRVLSDVVRDVISTGLIKIQKQPLRRWARTKTLPNAALEFAFDDPRYDNFFKVATTVNFALSSLGPGRALIVTRSELDAEPAEAAPRDCYCSVNATHPVGGGPPPKCTISNTDIVDCL